jgi:hypothetical protein
LNFNGSESSRTKFPPKHWFVSEPAASLNLTKWKRGIYLWIFHFNNMIRIVLMVFVLLHYVQHQKSRPATVKAEGEAKGKPADQLRFSIQFPEGLVIETSSWEEAEKIVKGQGFDPSETRFDERIHRTTWATSVASREPTEPKVLSIRTKLPMGRTDYLMRDKSVLQESIPKRDELRMVTTYDLMSRDLWRMTRRGESPFQTVR